MAKQIIVFSTPTCPYCIRLKQYLDEKGIAYKNVDVSIDPFQAEKMVEKSGHMGVPQIWIDDQVIVGFNQEEIQKILGL